MEKETATNDSNNISNGKYYIQSTKANTSNKLAAKILSPRRDENTSTESTKMLGKSSASKKSTASSSAMAINNGYGVASVLDMKVAFTDDSFSVTTKEKMLRGQSVDYNYYGFDKENDTPTINQKPSVIVTSPTPEHALNRGRDVEKTSLHDPPTPSTPPTHFEIEKEGTVADESLQSSNCPENENSISSAQTIQIDLMSKRTPNLRNADHAVIRDSKYGITTSNQRRYSSVVAELAGKRNSMAGDPMSINPSLVLSYQADLASPDGISYVSFPSNTSDESFDKNINFSPDPQRSEERKVNQTYSIYIDHAPSDPIPKAGQQHCEMVAIRTSQINKDSEERKSVSFLDRLKMNGGDSTFTSVSLYSPEDYLSCYSGEKEKNTSTPMENCFPRQLSFNQLSGGSSIPKSTESPMAGLIEKKGNSSPAKNSSKTKSFRSPKSPLRHRGSYAVPQSPECIESMNRTRARRRRIGIILIFIGLILYVFAFVGWFVILPYVESEEPIETLN